MEEWGDVGMLEWRDVGMLEMLEWEGVRVWNVRMLECWMWDVGMLEMLEWESVGMWNVGMEEWKGVGMEEWKLLECGMLEWRNGNWKDSGKVNWISRLTLAHLFWRVNIRVVCC